MARARARLFVLIVKMSSIDEEKQSKDAQLDFSAGNSVSQDKSPLDVFGDEEDHDIRYKTLSWQVATLFLTPSTSQSDYNLHNSYSSSAY